VTVGEGRELSRRAPRARLRHDSLRQAGQDSEHRGGQVAAMPHRRDRADARRPRR
jgi:hypothetical protein